MQNITDYSIVFVSVLCTCGVAGLVLIRAQLPLATDNHNLCSGGSFDLCYHLLAPFGTFWHLLAPFGGCLSGRFQEAQFAFQCCIIACSHGITVFILSEDPNYPSG
jgi:hypothetical protein